MKTFKEFLEGRKLRGSAIRQEKFPQGALFHQQHQNMKAASTTNSEAVKTIKNIEGWQVWFINSQNLPQDQYEKLIETDSELMKKIIASLKSIGVRKHNRVPVIFLYEVNTQDSGSYKSSDDYLKIYRDPNQNFETLVGTIAHEIGHAIYNKLPEQQYQTIKAHANQIGSYTKYTDPNFSSGEGHTTGNEWFADYVAATVMNAYGLSPSTKVGSWEPINDPTKGMAVVRKVLGAQEPSRNINKSAATFRQKNLWMFGVVRDLLQRLGTNDMPVASLNLPPQITSQLNSHSVKEILEEFLRTIPNRLESLDNADRNLFLQTLKKYIFNSHS